VSQNRVLSGPPPRICITVQAPERAADPRVAVERNERYVAAIRAAGGEPVAIDETSGPKLRNEVADSMDGLLLAGGTDLHPSLYGQSIEGSVDIEPGRDALELEAWEAARARRIPVLGICRGFQAINVFSGGRLVQHLAGHTAPPHGGALHHPLRVVPGSRLARILRPTGPLGALRVNSSHHQGVRAADLAPSLVASATSPYGGGDLVEAVESADPTDFVLGVQCHPERADSSPPEFARLFTVFVDAARGSAAGTRVG
jgi:putative glutamine amidotransferase